MEICITEADNETLCHLTNRLPVVRLLECRNTLNWLFGINTPRERRTAIGNAQRSVQ